MAIIDGYPATSFDKKDREWIKAVAGEVLPDTAEASAGDVLTVGEDGDAEWATPGGGGGGEIFQVTATGSDDVYTLNKTYAEIKTAYLAGNIVIITYENEFISDPPDPTIDGTTTDKTTIIGIVDWTPVDPLQGSEGHAVYAYFNSQIVQFRCILASDNPTYASF